MLARGAVGVERLSTWVHELASPSVVVVADAAVIANGYADTIVAAIADVDRFGSIVHAVPPGEPTERSVDEAADTVRRATGAVVVGIGGGSALDTAKLAAAVAGGSAGVGYYALGARTAAPRPARLPPSRPRPGPAPR